MQRPPRGSFCGNVARLLLHVTHLPIDTFNLIVVNKRGLRSYSTLAESGGRGAGKQMRISESVQ